MLSIDGPVVVQGTTLACGISLPAGLCQQCVAAQCCTQASACAADPACLALEGCLLNCGGDYACRAACVSANPLGDQQDVPALDTCVATSCAAGCGMVCGQAGSYTTPDAAEGCIQCIEGHACDPALACATDLGCQSIGHCAYACPTPDCRAACVADQPSADAFVTTALDVGFACYPACRVGHYWSCAGKVTWPLAKSTTPEVTLNVTDSHGSSQPFAGLAVKACDATDLACAGPVGTGTTDSKGNVTLTLPQLPAHAFGFQGYLDVSSPTGQIPPVLDFLSFPLSEPDAQLGLPIPSATELEDTLSLVGVTADPQRGHIAVIATDCVGFNAPDVTVSADGTDSETRVLYNEGQQPSTTATSTDITGVAYFFNVPPGEHTVQATPADVGHAVSSVHLLVRAGAMTVTVALPTPP